MAYRIQQRRDTAERWTSANPILLEGEVGYVTDNPNQYKIGDGKTAWNDLPYRGYTGTISQETGTDENAVMSQKATTARFTTIENKITNIADDEDLQLVATSADTSVLKLADRAYDEASFSGKGYKILRKNIVDGKNVLTQDMVNDENTIYEIRYDFVLQSYITLKNGSSFFYNGGSIIRNSGRITYPANENINTKIYNPFFADLAYNSNSIYVNKNTPVGIGYGGKLITQKADIICNNGLSQDNNNEVEINGYYTTRLLGVNRFCGDVKLNQTILYKNIYLSEFIKNLDNSYNYISGYKGTYLDLYSIYNKIASIFTNSYYIHYNIIVDIKNVYVSNTILLQPHISLICPETCMIYLGDNFTDESNKINIFENIGGSHAIKGILEGFTILVEENVFFDYVIKFNNNQYIFDLKRININCSLDNAYNYNGILKTYTEAYTNDNINPNGYSDFLYLEDIKGLIRKEKFDIIVGHGDCIEFKNLSNIKVLCLEGQKKFTNCMHTQIYSVRSNIVIENNHNETAHYNLYKSNVIFNGCVIGNAVGENKATITINDDSILDLVIEYFNPTESYINDLKRNIETNIVLNNVWFAYNEVSENNGFKTNLYDIEVQNKENVNIISNNSFKTYSWLSYDIIFDIYSNIDITKRIFPQISPNINNITSDQIIGSELKLEGNSWYTKNDWTEYYNSLSDNEYNIKIKNIISLLDFNRLIGQKKDINQSYTFNNKKYAAVILRNIDKGNYFINVEVDDSEKYIKTTIPMNCSNSLFKSISKYAFWGHSYIDGNITEYNECNNIDILNDSNVRAYLNEIPKYGVWNINDECVINNITYIYDGENWILKDGLSSDTSSRPITNVPNGYIYFDTTLNKPIWWTGTEWVDATGVSV